MKTTRRASFFPALIIALVALLALLTGVGLLSAQSGFGTGWTVQYFNNNALSGTPILTETLPGGINFTWGTGSPNPAVPADNFSARYTSVQNLQAGTYEFVVSSDDGVRVFIDNVLVLDRFFARVLTTDRFTLNLTAGAHTFTVEYVEYTDQAALSFQWFLTSVTTPGGTVPPGGGGGGTIATLNPAVPTVYTGPIATVRGVNGLALRTGPYVGASFITTLQGGSSYPVLARNADEGIYNWYLLQLIDGRTGWASGRYLQLSVDRNTLPVQGSIFDQIDDAPDLNVIAIPRAVMNIRRRPSERTAVIGSIPWGAPASVIGRTVQAGQSRWLQVRYEGIVGWIAAPWVTVQGEIFAVPVR
jgi:uncharacterized protein YgiM (DUF1202 family)